MLVLHDVSKDREYARTYQASHDELTGLINRREFRAAPDVHDHLRDQQRQHAVRTWT